MPPGWITLAISVAALGIAGWSAWMARTNLLIARGNAVTRLLDAYASPDMDAAVAALRLARKPIEMHLAGEFHDDSNFHHAVGLALMERFGEARRPPATGLAPYRDTPAAAMMKVLRESGRRLHWFVKQADILRRNGALPEALFRQAVAETNGYRVWAEVWLPYLKASPIDGQPSDHLAWADTLLKAIPAVGGTD